MTNIENTDKYYSAGAHMTQEQERERTNNGRTGSQMPLTLCCQQVCHCYILLYSFQPSRSISDLVTDLLAEWHMTFYSTEY